ncbi:MAG: biotin--[acetyl-CoA-carboxylase] ligase [Rubrivivax sp.]|nr:biotin--[acetyl-CoA-carboxylase] ligase [Rubrivivax sp.]
MTASETLQLAWNTQALWSALDPLLPGVAVEVMARVESTNTALVERARLSSSQRTPAWNRSTAPASLGSQPQHGRRSMDFQPCLLVAEHQTRGRGRMGRSWSAQPGASLTFSLALPLSPVDWSGLSLAVGAAIADVLESPAQGLPLQLRLKWPNDLWLQDSAAPLGGRKLGGILIETVPIGGRRMCVVGIGLNILPIAGEDFSSGSACLQELLPGASAPQVLALIAPALARAVQRFESLGFAAFMPSYAERDALAGQRVTTTQAGAPSGVAEGVDERGALRLLCDDGRRVLVNSGEVSVRPGGVSGQAS